MIGGLVAASFLTLTLNLFYRRGASLLDAGWFADLSARSDWSMTDPRAIDRLSFAHIHLMPIFELTSGIAGLLPLSAPQFFAVLLGLAHAVPSVACWYLLVVRHGLAGLKGWALAIFLAFGLGFSGLAVAIALYPHPEILIAASIILFFVAFVEGRHRLALGLLMLALTTREDAGLHIFGFLMLWALSAKMRGAPWQAEWRTLAFAGVALSCSVLEILAQSWLWPGGSPFGRVYLGNPAFAHLDLSTLAERTAGLLIYRSYIAGPALIALAWAIAARDPRIVLGYAALIPWTVLHLCAAEPFAFTITGYYGFPYLVAMIWPLLILGRHDAIGPREGQIRPVFGMALMVLAGVALPGEPYNPSRAVLPRDLLIPPTVERQRDMDAAAHAVAEARPHLGQLLAADQLIALDPAGFIPEETIFRTSAGQPDTVVLTESGIGYEQLDAASAGLPHRWRLRGTMFSIASNRDIRGITALAGSIDPPD